MKYTPIALITGVALLWCATPVRADEATKSAKAEELLHLTQTDQMMKMLEPMKGIVAAQMNKTDMSAEQRAQAVEMQEKMMAQFADRLSKAKPALVKVYTDTYTEEELDGILAFYKSPSGKAMLLKMPQVIQRSMPLMMQLMGDLIPEMKKMTVGSQPGAQRASAPNAGPVLPDVNLPNVNMAQYGDPLGVIGPPSNEGRGGGGGYRAGVAGVTMPTLQQRIEPEYSEEAHAAKLQGVVVLSCEITPLGVCENTGFLGLSVWAWMKRRSKR